MRQNFTFCKPWAKCNYITLTLSLALSTIQRHKSNKTVNRSPDMLRISSREDHLWFPQFFTRFYPHSWMMILFLFAIVFLSHWIEHYNLQRDFPWGYLSECVNTPTGVFKQKYISLEKRTSMFVQNHNMGLTLNPLLRLAPLSHSCVLVWICVAFSAPFWNSRSPRLSGTPQVKVMGRF